MGPVEAELLERVKSAKESIWNSGYEPEPEPEYTPYTPQRWYYAEQPCSPDCAWARAMKIDGTRHVTVERIIKETCGYFKMRKAELIGKRRSRSVVRPRQIGMYLAKHLTTRSYPDLGMRFGDRDHTTVLHAVRKIDGLVRTDKDINRQVKEIRHLLVGNAYWKIEGLD